MCRFKSGKAVIFNDVVTVFTLPDRDDHSEIEIKHGIRDTIATASRQASFEYVPFKAKDVYDFSGYKLHWDDENPGWATAEIEREITEQMRVVIKDTDFAHYDSLDLSGCEALTKLPAGLTVGGYLDLSYCTALVSLPAGLTVGGNLYLNGCRALVELPAGLTVGGNLNLSGCKTLVSLPAGLTVGGYLNLSGCKALAELPAGLTVGGNLYLSGCKALVSLPAGLTVGGYLNLSGCEALAELPNRLDEMVKGTVY